MKAKDAAAPLGLGLAQGLPVEAAGARIEVCRARSARYPSIKRISVPPMAAAAARPAGKA